MRMRAEELGIAKLETEIEDQTSLQQRKVLERNGTLQRPTQSPKVTKPFQSSEGPQMCYRTFMATST